MNEDMLIEDLERRLRGASRKEKKAIVKIKELEAKFKNAEDHTRELEALFDLQRTRIKEAEKMWQKATGKEAIFPDLGELLSWFMGKIKQLEAECDECKRVIRERTKKARAQYMQDALR